MDYRTQLVFQDKVGRLYDPTRLPDYKKEHFGDYRHKLIQQPMYNFDLTLIRPWEQRTSLEAGTIVMVQATLNRVESDNLIVRISV